MTASSQANAFLVSNDTNATNLQNNNVWNRGLSSTNLKIYSDRVKDYLSGGDVNVYYDAWGNALGIELLVNATSTCQVLYSPVHGNTCIRVINPPYPQQNYKDVFSLRPPYIGYIYSEFCHNLTNSTQNSCRIPIVYAN